MIELRDPIPKKFPATKRYQSLPIIVGDWSLGTIKDLWPCYSGVLKSNCVIVNCKDDMENLHKNGFFGQSSVLGKKTFKQKNATSENLPRKKRRKNWDQIIISSSLPDIEMCLKENEQANCSESKRIEDSQEKMDVETEGEENQSANTVDIDDSFRENLVKKGMTLDLTDSEEEEEEELSVESSLDELSSASLVKDLDPFSDSGSALNLTYEEAFFLNFGLGCLYISSDEDEILTTDQLFNIFKTRDSNFLHKYVVYHYYRSKGWIVKCGIKFGCDFLLYKQGPPFYHASYNIVIDKGKPMSWTTLMGLSRLAGTVNKELIIAKVSLPEEDTLENLKSAAVSETLYRRWVATSEVNAT